jgi:hypothetical protein
MNLDGIDVFVSPFVAEARRIDGQDDQTVDDWLGEVHGRWMTIYREKSHDGRLAPALLSFAVPDDKSIEGIGRMALLATPAKWRPWLVRIELADRWSSDSETTVRLWLALPMSAVPATIEPLAQEVP